MSGRVSLVGLGLLALLSWMGVGTVVFHANPTDPASRLLFFALLYVALVTTLGLAAYAASFRLFASRARGGNLKRSLQHGGLWATFIVAAAILQLFRILSWPSAVLLFGLLVVGQILLLARQQGRGRRQEKGTGKRRASRKERASRSRNALASSDRDNLWNFRN